MSGDDVGTAYNSALRTRIHPAGLRSWSRVMEWNISSSIYTSHFTSVLLLALSKTRQYVLARLENEARSCPPRTARTAPFPALALPMVGIERGYADVLGCC